MPCRPATAKLRPPRAGGRESRDRDTAISRESSSSACSLPIYNPQFRLPAYKASRFRTSPPPIPPLLSPDPHPLLTALRSAPRPPGSRRQDRRRPATSAGEAIWPPSSCTGGPPSACASPRRSTRWSPVAPSAPSSPFKCSSSSTSL